MLPLRFARHWIYAGTALLLLVLLFALLPALWLWPITDDLIPWLFSTDKWVHLLTFVFLAVWFAGQFAPRAYWQVGAGLIVFGLLIEVCQRAVGYRSAEWLDVAADVAGIIIGLAIASAGLGGWSLRVEAWYQNRPAGVD